MELVWLIVQALVFCTVLLAVISGLVFAPWYALLAALGIVLIVIQQSMSKLRRDASEPAIPRFQENPAIARTNSSTKTAQTASTKPILVTPHSTHLIYRGTDYILSHDSEEHSV